MKKLKVLVADNQVVVRQQLLQELRKDEYIEIVGAVDNGKDAYEIFEREEPNIVIFDLLLPIYDGYVLLDKMNEHGIHNNQKLVMTTPLTNNMLVSEAFNQGVDYVLTKPYDARAISVQLRMIHDKMNQAAVYENVMAGNSARKIRNTNIDRIYNSSEFDRIYQKLDEIISNRLNEIGIPVRLKGYNFIITAVKEVLGNDGKLEAVTKVLYPDVARKHGSTPQRVEKAIRHAIEVAWMIDENNPIHKEFKYIMGAGKDRPTNSEFIAKLTQDVRLKYYKQTIAC
ncbi:MAG: response regulator [Eubacterium sp.]|jgi:two-component system response regulator (stage 0 sporulation protein A)|nr:response regulator [Eubacterium sp.]MCI9617851.1 response regulator [Eubacterium sp.]